MSPRLLLRCAAGATALFTIGHSFGTFAEQKDAAASLVLAAMRTVHFDVFGSSRTYWDMFHGYAILIIFVAAFLAVLLWQLSALDPRVARPMVLAVAAVQLGFAAISFADFFWAPAPSTRCPPPAPPPRHSGDTARIRRARRRFRGVPESEAGQELGADLLRGGRGAA